ncbi:uncharacterized protein LOC116339995, partial [Contarinia nasturtii]|uniref:uncharacterized protein LOC116339995 n=1 Tax=Contarinia nasturtii TaxID=265458 RepID=UPI0012D46E46
MLVSSAYCDTVYKSYKKPEFYSISRYETLKKPCALLPDKIPGFNFISSIARSFRYLRVHRFRHPSSLRGVYNPLSFANNVSSIDLSDSSTNNSTPSSTQTVPDSAERSSDGIYVQRDNAQSTQDSCNHTEFQYQQGYYPSYESAAPNIDGVTASYKISSENVNIHSSRPENIRSIAS